MQRITVRKILLAPPLALVYLYKYVISPLTPAACRHLPTCSQYAVDALKLHGPFDGSRLAANRIARCHPWGTSGFDPVPVILIKKIDTKKYDPYAKHYPHSDRLKEHAV